MTTTPKEPAKSYQVATHQDKNGDVLLPIPPALLKQLGWTEGDNVEFCAGENGTYILRKK